MNVDSPCLRVLCVMCRDAVFDEPIKAVANARLSRLVGAEMGDDTAIGIAADTMYALTLLVMNQQNARGTNDLQENPGFGDTQCGHGVGGIRSRHCERRSLAKTRQFCAACRESACDLVDGVDAVAYLRANQA